LRGRNLKKEGIMLRKYKNTKLSLPTTRESKPTDSISKQCLGINCFGTHLKTLEIISIGRL